MRRLLLLLNLIAVCAVAQQYPLYRYSVDEGLAHANVYRIMQDRKGFIWFSTNFGLSRFDGKHFLNYSTANGLPNNVVMSVSEDYNGEKWICTFGGGLCILSANGRLRQASFNNALPGKTLFSEEWKGVRWVIGVDSIRTLFCVKDGKVTRLSLPGFNGHSAAVYKIVQSAQKIFFLTENGIYTADAQYHLRPFLPQLIRGKVTDMQVAASGNYWIGKEGELLHVIGGKPSERFSLQGDEVTDMQLDRAGRLWISAADQGILTIENHQLHNLSPNVSIGNVLINDVYEDAEGNIWFATHGEGASRLNSLDFIRYGIEKGLMNAYCKALAPYGNDVYTGSFGTVSLWHEGSLQPIPIPYIRHHVFVYFIRIIDGNLYIGTPYGLVKKPIGAGPAVMLNPKEHPLGIIAMCKDGEGRIWLGSYSALYRLEGDEPVEVKESTAPLDKRINALCADKKGRLWLGTDSGIYMKRGGGGFQKMPAAATGIVNDIYEDTASGDVWFAAEHALAVFRNERLHILPAGNGSRPEKFNTITGDGAGNIWAGSVNGLLSVEPRSLSIRDYKTDIGEVLAIYCAGEQMFLGTVNGLSVIRPSGVDDKLAPAVYITSVATDTAQTDFPQKLRLPYRNNKLRIEFSALHFRFPKSVDYRYRIEGLDTAWHLTTGNTIEIPALPSGTFRFLVSARKNGGEWSKPAILPINVATPLWRQTWAMIAAAVLMLLLLYFGIRAAVGRIEAGKRRRLLLFNKMLYLKQQALGALINPHFIFNAMNSIQHYLNRNDNAKANQYLADFAGLIRLTLQHGQDAFIPLATELARLRLYLSLEQLRTGPDLQFEILADDALLSQKLYIPNMVLQPYVENAIWHGIIPKDAPGLLRIQFNMQAQDTVSVTITDDGVGYSETVAQRNAAKQSGLGMSLTAERLALFRKLLNKAYSVDVAALKDSGGQPAGTRVTVMLPCLHSAEEWTALEHQYA